MGSITRSLSNNITTSGVITASGITNDSVSAVTSFANAANPATLVLLSTQTASNSATISFTTGLDSTYDEYIFKFIDIHPANDSVNFSFNGSLDNGSNYNVVKTSTIFDAFHNEADTSTGLTYESGIDIAQGTGNIRLDAGDNIGADNDQCLVGYVKIFNPSSTTFVKHWISRVTHSGASNYSLDTYTAGYFNTTSAVNAIQFKMSSGNFDGIIKLYGVKKS